MEQRATLGAAAVTINIEVDEPFAAQVDTTWLHRAAVITLEGEGRTTAELTLVVTDDPAIQELNRRYRNVDAPTDVLAFGGETPDFVTAPDAGDYLGDVIISYPRAAAQATDHTVPEELALLVVHGVLHLLGYDHDTASNRTRMWSQQAAILTRLGLAAIQPAADAD